MKKILIPLPKIDFDPSEAAILWKTLSSLGDSIIFATPDGRLAHADIRMLTGKGLGPFKKLLMANSIALKAYNGMFKSKEFQNPIFYTDVNLSEFDGLYFPGGHAPGMKPYLEDKLLQSWALNFFQNKKPIAAICHGVLIPARTVHPTTGRSILYEYKTTALIQSGELLAWLLTKPFVGNYYRTYPEKTVEQEVKENLKNVMQFLKGPPLLLRDNEKSLHRGFIVKDRHYISGRWPGDVHQLSHEFHGLLKISGI